MNVEAKLALDVPLTRRLLVDTVRAEFARFGFQKAVLGVSGGVDSSLAAYLAAEALGAKNVRAVWLPYRTTAPESYEDAHEVIQRLGLPSVSVEITDMVEPLFERFPDMGNRRRGNVMARARMIVLYDQSEEWGGLVVGTSNKTELLLGYGTLFGDMASAVNPLGDLYKTQVRQLARAMGVPERIIAKPPSADLWPGQTDEGEMGLTYPEADKVLYLMVDERRTLDEVVAMGFSRDFVKTVWNMVQRSQYKRLPPIIAKISNGTAGWEFRMPRDWGT
jgi:NAD+ synthase